MAVAAAGAAGTGPLAGSGVGVGDISSPGRGVDHPTHSSSSRERLVAAVTPAPSDGEHRFLHTDASGDPVRYDPCQPLRVVVRTGAAPTDVEPLVRDAVAQTAEATGLPLLLEGATDETPSWPRAAYQRDRYGDRWAPVLIAWSDPDEDPHLAGPVAGTGGSTAYGTGRGAVGYVSGQVTLDTPQLVATLAEPGGEERVRAVVMHELAHVVGLDHVDDPGQLMHPEAQPEVTSFADGDLTGLARAGSGGCLQGL